MITASQIKNVFEDYLIKEKFSQSPSTLYDPANYILSLKAKRARPVLLLLAYQTFHDDVNKALSAAHAVEVFHNFTLVHDDIMDEAPTRRGDQTVHEKYDTNHAILSGDVMLLHAYQYLMNAEYDDKSSLFNYFNHAAIEICEGQQMDMDFETMPEVEIEDYIEMIRKKTAVLLGVSLQIGALLGGASHDEAEKLYQFGTQFGISFQIQDDILDTYADPDKFGKQVGGDIIQGKKTYLFLKTRQLLEGDNRTNFESAYYGNSTDKVDQVKQYFRDVNAKEYAVQVRDAYHDLAFSYLSSLGVEASRMAPLMEYTKGFIQREF